MSNRWLKQKQEEKNDADDGLTIIINDTEEHEMKKGMIKKTVIYNIQVVHTFPDKFFFSRGKCQ